jgi:hypothetical protein
MGEVTVFEWREQFFRTQEEALREAKRDILHDTIAADDIELGGKDFSEIGTLTLPQFIVAVIKSGDLDELERLSNALKAKFEVDWTETGKDQ